MSGPIISIRVVNFQSHPDTLFELHPGVNVITGIGDSGKTVVKRLVDWVRTYRPTGNRYRSDFADGADTLGDLVFDDGRVKLTKGQAGAIYEINGQPLRKFKTTVPVEVPALINMKEINFQGQYDKPFLLTMTKGKLAQMFNRVAKLDDVVLWLADLGEKKASENTTLSEARVNHGLAQNLLVMYESFNRIGRLKELSEIAANGDAEWERLSASAYAARIVYGRIQNRLDRLEKLPDIGKVNELLILANGEDAVYRSLTSIAELLKGCGTKRKRSDRLSDAATNIELRLNTAREEEALFKDATAKLEDLKALKAKKGRLAGTQTLRDQQAKVYSQALKNAGKCPMCFTDIDEAMIELINTEVTK